MIDYNKYDTIILGFGAHTIKNRCIEQLKPLFETGKIDAFVTNGASVLHDTEIAMYNDTSEDVGATIKEGNFGWNRRSCGDLNNFISSVRSDSLGNLIANFIAWRCEFADNSVFWNAYKNKVQPIVSIGIGHDIYQMYGNFDPAAWAKASYEDFTRLTKIISDTKRGLFVCVGSKVFVPMVIEKAFSTAKNRGSECVFDSLVCDLFDLKDIDGSEYIEKDINKVGYYERQLKTFGRISENIEYLKVDNRNIYQRMYEEIRNEL
jgi:hypothetical protein